MPSYRTYQVFIFVFMFFASLRRARRSQTTLSNISQCPKINPKNQNIVASLGFTLVELLVVIMILAVLGTMGFLSLRSMNDSARDATRLNDIKNVTTSIEHYLTQNGVVPHPTNETIITYSGSAAWYQ